ncbi:hypothetical protein ABZ671_29880 [Micromonospora sp. NPDC006766]|uniref:hypothetical protein n=1 Tax=Micromonospora sp. NPDC006766 TaxID=3154778 RepID=UPI0033D01B90
MTSRGRLGWTTTVPVGVKVNDRIMRMAQEQAGRVLRSVKWRADLTAGILATWPADPGKRTRQEWDQVRGSVPGGPGLPSSVIKGRTRQAATFLTTHGRLPVDVFEVEGVPRVTRMLLLAACDRQQATIERSDTDPGKALLRLQLPTRADPRSYRDWTWVACPIALPPTVPVSAVLHLPTLRVVGGQFRAAGILAKQHRLRRQSERLHTKADHYQQLIPRAQATQGTLPHPTPRSGGQASGGTRTNGPDPTAPRSPPAPERDHDQHTHHQPPTQRGSARRRIPPPRPRHPAQVGNDPGNSLQHRIA